MYAILHHVSARTGRITVSFQVLYMCWSKRKSVKTIKLHAFKRPAHGTISGSLLQIVHQRVKMGN